MAKDVMDGFKIARLVHNPSKENTSKANNRTGNEKKGRILKRIKEAEEAGISLDNLAELPHTPAPRGRKRDRQHGASISETSRAVSSRTGQNELEGADSLLQLSQQPVAQSWNQPQGLSVAHPQWSFQTPCHRTTSIPNATPQASWQQSQYQQQAQADPSETDAISSGYLAPDFDALVGLDSYTREPQLQQPLEPNFATTFRSYDDVFPQARPESAPALGYMMNDALDTSYNYHPFGNDTMQSAGIPQPSKRRRLGNALSPLAE